MNRLNILLLIYKLDVAGAEKVVAELAIGMDKEKFNPVVCCFKSGLLAEEIRKANIPVYTLGKKSKFDLWFLYSIIQVIKKEKIDIVHAHTFSPNFWGRILGKLSGVPVIITTEHTICGIKKKHKKYLDRILARFSHKIIAVSERVRQSHITEERISPEKIITIYNGVSSVHEEKILGEPEIVRRKRDFGFKPQVPLVISVGRLEPPKGYKYFLEAIKLVIAVQPEVQFLIVGDGSLRNELGDLAKKLEITEHVFFAGFRTNVFELLQLADISVLSSVREGFSVTLLESMAVGKPMIATDVGGNSEAVQNGVTGFIVPPGNPQALAESMLRLINNKKLISEMGEKAKKCFLDNFTADKMVRKTEAVYLSQLSFHITP